jgi:phenylalanyl-tRNA synthetase alpha chain
MQDTFFVEGDRILRSHTSPIQVRTMLAGPPPVKIIAPGYAFRRDDDATHTPMFPQVEGLHVDRAVSFEDLKATLVYFVRQFFGSRTDIRLRPSFFPFTEPSAEVDASCFKCEGRLPERRSCRLCKGTGWLEIGGSGMVHPNVLRAVGYDKHDVTGFAFGVGPSRMAMLKYGVSDLRTFYENDLRFLASFAAV